MLSNTYFRAMKLSRCSCVKKAWVSRSCTYHAFSTPTRSTSKLVLSAADFQYLQSLPHHCGTTCLLPPESTRRMLLAPGDVNGYLLLRVSARQAGSCEGSCCSQFRVAADIALSFHGVHASQTGGTAHRYKQELSTEHLQSSCDISRLATVKKLVSCQAASWHQTHFWSSLSRCSVCRWLPRRSQCNRVIMCKR